MNLIDLYRCLSEEPRLRLVHILAQGPLCVCHFQEVLQLPQVAVSKHLAYLRKHGVVSARRYQQWKIYELHSDALAFLKRQIDALNEYAANDKVLRDDLKRLKRIGCRCEWVQNAAAE